MLVDTLFRSRTGEGDELHILGRTRGRRGVFLVHPGSAAGPHHVERIIFSLLGGGTDPRLAVGLDHGAREGHNRVNNIIIINDRSEADRFRDGVQIYEETGGGRRGRQAPEWRSGAGERSSGNLGKKLRCIGSRETENTFNL